MRTSRSAATALSIALVVSLALVRPSSEKKILKLAALAGMMGGHSFIPIPIPISKKVYHQKLIPIPQPYPVHIPVHTHEQVHHKPHHVHLSHKEEHHDEGHHSNVVVLDSSHGGGHRGGYGGGYGGGYDGGYEDGHGGGYSDW